MFPNWSVQNEILKRAQRESNHEWSKTETPPLPHFEKPPKIKLTAGLVNFAKTLLLNLRP